MKPWVLFQEKARQHTPFTVCIWTRGARPPRHFSASVPLQDAYPEEERTTAELCLRVCCWDRW